jgi:hypothetical protein
VRLRFAVALAPGVALALVALPARAQERTDPFAYEHKRYESPQNFAIEIRVSPYKPDIDSDPALHGQTPYASVFGTSPRMMLGLEFDWQALHIPHFGTIGPGGGIGYTTMSAPAALTNPPPGCAAPCLSGENTSLSIYPMYAVAVARADFFDEELGIPLVPYAKAGLGYALWSASNDLGTSSYNGVVGKGHSVGTMLAFGIGLDLNVFDNYAARNFDNAAGVNHTLLFAEYYSLNLTGLLQTDALRVGTSSWAFGLAFEF